MAAFVLAAFTGLLFKGFAFGEQSDRLEAVARPRDDGAGAQQWLASAAFLTKWHTHMTMREAGPAASDFYMDGSQFREQNNGEFGRLLQQRSAQATDPVLKLRPTDCLARWDLNAVGSAATRACLFYLASPNIGEGDPKTLEAFGRVITARIRLGDAGAGPDFLKFWKSARPETSLKIPADLLLPLKEAWNTPAFQPAADQVFALWDGTIQTAPAPTSARAFSNLLQRDDLFAQPAYCHELAGLMDSDRVIGKVSREGNNLVYRFADGTNFYGNGRKREPDTAPKSVKLGDFMAKELATRLVRLDYTLQSIPVDSRRPAVTALLSRPQRPLRRERPVFWQDTIR